MAVAEFPLLSLAFAACLWVFLSSVLSQRDTETFFLLFSSLPSSKQGDRSQSSKCSCRQKVDVGTFKELAMTKYKRKWVEEINHNQNYAHNAILKQYMIVWYDLSESQRSLCAWFRSGMLALHMETGRYTGFEVDCELVEVECEIH